MRQEDRPRPPRGVLTMAGRSGVPDLDVDSLCQEYVNGQSTLQAPKRLAEGIQSGAIDLLKVVEALGVFLTSTNVENRSQGTRLLSEVLSHLHSHALSPDEVHYVVVFYCDRLKDRAVVIPAVLYGIQALVTYQKLEAEDVINVSRTIFKEVHNQSMQHSDRRILFNIMDTLLSSCLESVQAMGSDFVLGYIQALDGEKDPRNLVIAFHSVLTIVGHLPFEVLAEDLFEVTSCYFPIDFTPPPNDPHGVSREALILGLRRCLTATPKFAEFCLPLLLEKLSSDVQSAKLDSLLTLVAGVEVFGAEALKPYLEPMWFALRNEAFQSASEEVEAASLQALTAVVRALSRPLLPSGGGRGALGEFLEMVKKDCQRYLREPELRLMRAAGCLLQAVARASDPACVAVTSSAVPLLLEQLTHQTQVGLQRTILTVLLEFVEVAKSYSQGEEVPSPLLPYKDSLLALLLSLLGDSHAQLRVAVIATIAGLVGVAGLLEGREVGLVAEHLLRTATGDMDSTVRRESSTALGGLARLHPAVVEEGVLRTLLATLTTATPMETDDSAPPPPRVADHTHLIATISTHHTIVSVALPALLDYLGQLAGELYSIECQELARAASESARSIAERSVAEESSITLLHESIAPRVLSQCVAPSVTSPLVEPHVLLDEAVLGSCAALLRCCAQALDVSSSQSLLKLVLDVFVRGSVEQLAALSPGQPFAPLDPTSPARQTQLVTLLTATIGALRPSVLDGYYPELLPPLFQLACRCRHAPSSLQAAMAYASLVNKMEDGPELAQLLDRDTHQLWSCLSDTSHSSEQVTRALTVWLWLTKALVMRSHPTSRAAAIKLVSLCASPSLGPQAADGFQLILSDTSDILNRRCHANSRLMHRQLFFTVVVPEIVQQFHQAVPSVQRHLLQALAHVMQGVPKQVLLGELPSLLPLLLESLGCEDDGLRLCSLEALLSLAQDAPQAISEHMHALVPRLLGLARSPRSMKVRMAALRCVGVLTTLPHHVAFPHKQEVLKGLAPCLDDKKRLVRKEAVKSRSDWFLLGAL